MGLDGPAADGRRVHFQAGAAMHFGGGKAIRSGRFGRAEFAQERFNVVRPMRSMIAAGNTGRPGILLMVGGGAQVVGIKLVEA